jgi:hypothetical protein
LFLCFAFMYINWHRFIYFMYGFFAIKRFWSPCLIDMPTNVFPILMVHFD